MDLNFIINDKPEHKVSYASDVLSFLILVKALMMSLLLSLSNKSTMKMMIEFVSVDCLIHYAFRAHLWSVFDGI